MAGNLTWCDLRDFIVAILDAHRPPSWEEFTFTLSAEVEKRAREAIETERRENDEWLIGRGLGDLVSKVKADAAAPSLSYDVRSKSWRDTNGRRWLPTVDGYDEMRYSPREGRPFRSVRVDD